MGSVTETHIIWHWFAQSCVITLGIFCLIAFLGVFPFEVLLEILLTTYIFKVIVATLDTPFMYLARRFRPTDSPAGTAA